MPWALAGVAALSMLAGGVLALQSVLQPPSKAAIRDNGLVSVSGRKHPEDFGLPSCPAAFDFFSTESEPGREYVSAAFSVRNGTMKEISAFYRKALPKKGWRFQREAPETMRPGYPTIPDAPTLRGVRQRWRSADGKRELSVLVVEDRQKRRTGQVLLSLAPARRAAE